MDKRMVSAKPGQPAPKPSGRRRGLRFLLLFSVYLVAGFILALAPFAQPAVRSLTRLVTIASAFLIRLCGGQAATNGDMLVGSGSAIQVANGCNGLNVTLLLWAAVAAFPAPALRRVKGLAAGTMLIHAVNLVRVISLFYLARRGGLLFDLAHLYLWESLIIVGVLAFFWLWAERAYKACGSVQEAHD